MANDPVLSGVARVRTVAVRWTTAFAMAILI